jgi:hypothetical protein
MRELLTHVMEAGIFEPADPEEVRGRKEKIAQRRIQQRAATAEAPWKIGSLTIRNPIYNEDSDDSDSAHMDRWWKNHKIWKDRGINEVEEDWNRITFRFNNFITYEEARALVSEFIQDWAYGPSRSQNPEIGQMVYLYDEGDTDSDSRWPKDKGRITKIEAGVAKVRFGRAGVIIIPLAKLTYDKEAGGFEVYFDKDFQKMITTQKTPKVGRQILIRLPRKTAVDNYSQNTDTPLARISSVGDKTIGITYKTFIKAKGATQGSYSYTNEHTEVKIEVPASDVKYDVEDRIFKLRGYDQKEK